MSVAGMGVGDNVDCRSNGVAVIVAVTVRWPVATASGAAPVPTEPIGITTTCRRTDTRPATGRISKIPGSPAGSRGLPVPS